MLRQHFGDWITLHAHAERDPFRLTITLTVGELPDAWKGPRPRAARTWTALVGLVLVLPVAAFIVANLLNGAGVKAPIDWIGSSSVAILAVSVSLFVGIPVAFVVNLWRITEIGLRRRHSELEGLLELEFAPLHLIVVSFALIIGGLFVAHLAADSFACVNGVRSAC